MGLDIKEYCYSYSMLHRIRQLALEYDGIECNIYNYYDNPEPETSFPNLVHHSDCDGIYISKSSEQYDKYYKHYNGEPIMIGDLDELKEELKILKPFIEEKIENNYMYAGIQSAWNDFYNDVMSAKKILKFH